MVSRVKAFIAKLVKDEEREAVLKKAETGIQLLTAISRDNVSGVKEILLRDRKNSSYRQISFEAYRLAIDLAALYRKTDILSQIDDNLLQKEAHMIMHEGGYSSFREADHDSNRLHMRNINEKYNLALQLPVLAHW